MIRIIVALTLLIPISPSVTKADVIVAEDFLYAQPTKTFGAGGGFTRQDHGGGQNGDSGQWLGRWVSVGDGVITGADISEEVFNLETDQFAGATRNGLSVNWLERDFQLTGLESEQTIYFGVTMRSASELSMPDATFTINNAGAEGQIGMGLTQGGFRALLGVPEEGDETGIVPGPELTDGLDPHRLIGKLEINALGSDERLTVWLDPSDVETAENSIEVESDVIGGVSDLSGNLRLDHRASSSMVLWDDLALGTTWESVATVDVPRATLFADADSRMVNFKNTTGGELDITFLQLESSRLRDTRWESLADQGVEGFQENNPTTIRITESNYSGSFILQDEASFGWGRVFNRTDDLVAHVGSADGLLNVATIVYGPLPEDPNAGGPDFDNDGTVGAGDLDALCIEIAAGTNNVAFDLTDDNQVDTDDLVNWLGQFGSFAGDTNLDKEVSFDDFLTLSLNFGQSDPPPTWSHGDFDCNGEVDFGDFLTLSDNFGQQSEALSASVPEPDGLFLLALGFCTLLIPRKLASRSMHA